MRSPRPSRASASVIASTWSSNRPRGNAAIFVKEIGDPGRRSQVIETSTRLGSRTRQEHVAGLDERNYRVRALFFLGGLRHGIRPGIVSRSMAISASAFAARSM